MDEPEYIEVDVVKNTRVFDKNGAQIGKMTELKKE